MKATPLPERIAEAQADLAEARADLAKAESATRADPSSRALQVTADAERATVAVIDRKLATLDGTGQARTDGLKPGSWQAELKDSTAPGARTDGYAGWKNQIFKKLQNPDLALYKIQQTIYKFSFLMVPLSIPFVALLFLWRRGTTLYDHGVFVLYSLTAISILFVLVSVVAPWWGPLSIVSGLAVLFIPPIHMFAQLKGAYGLSVWSAAWRTALLLVFSLMVLVLFLLLIITLGLTG